MVFVAFSYWPSFKKHSNGWAEEMSPCEFQERNKEKTAQPDFWSRYPDERPLITRTLSVHMEPSKSTGQKDLRVCASGIAWQAWFGQAGVFRNDPLELPLEWECVWWCKKVCKKSGTFWQIGATYVSGLTRALPPFTFSGPGVDPRAASNLFDAWFQYEAKYTVVWHSLSHFDPLFDPLFTWTRHDNEKLISNPLFTWTRHDNEKRWLALRPRPASGTHHTPPPLRG